MAYTLDQFVDYFSTHRPDAVLLLGDRYEIFAVGQAAALLEIPLIHISGGDVTHGAADDYFRHCLTKMASLHFPACEEYAKRVIRMGEDPATVENVGGLGDQNLRNMHLMSKAELEKSIGFSLEKPYVLVTYHPETAGGASAVGQFQQLLTALEKLSVHVIFTKSNADAGGAEINRCIDEICAIHPDKYIAFTSLGVLRYLSAMKYCAAVVGNSSSGVVETPTLGIPAVNIGRRQEGRILCQNVICCDADAASIQTAVEKALTPAFVQQAKATVSPYNGGDTSGRMVRGMERFLTGPRCGKPKIFYDGE